MGFPKENMDKLLKSASGQKTLINIDRIVYDAFWNGIGLIIVVETDNNGRTAPQIKSIMNKNGGEVKTPNSVTHMFKEIGLLSINTKKLGISNETIESQAIECGCDDYVINEKDPEDDESNEAFNVQEANLIYYRQPVKIQVQGCVDPYTGVASPVNVQCEFKDDIVELMIDEAAAILAGDIESGNQFSRGTEGAERNN